MARKKETTPDTKAAPKESLSAFVERMTGQDTQRISEALGDGFVRLRLSEAEKRQALQDIRCTEDAVIEMLRNARDAGATLIFLATHKTETTRRLVMLDNGSGIAPAFHETIFEPRVTTKLDSASMDDWGIHGRGMALFSIAANAQSACVTQSEKGAGTAIAVQIDLKSLGEVKDQSTLPDLVRADDKATNTKHDGSQVVPDSCRKGLQNTPKRHNDESKQTPKHHNDELQLGPGPNNIYKTCAGFALSEAGASQTFVGSDAEIIASIRALFFSRAGRQTFTQASLESAPPEKRYGIFTPLIDAQDGDSLVAAAESLGLSISQRNAHRILAKEVKPTPDILRRIREKPKTAKVPKTDAARGLLEGVQSKRKIRLTPRDTQELLDAFTKDVQLLQERYYLVCNREPKLTFRNGHLRVDFHFDVDENL